MLSSFLPQRPERGRRRAGSGAGGGDFQARRAPPRGTKTGGRSTGRWGRKGEREVEGQPWLLLDSGEDEKLLEPRTMPGIQPVLKK
jgi:hypothetical protein